jgi:hypothetical protein
VLLEGIDQAHLSGMEPALSGEAVENGGYVAHQLDAGPFHKSRGGQGQVSVPTDGHHVLVFQAFDKAGNASNEKELVFKIDRTAPVGAFRPVDVLDPRALRVDVKDVTSGVAGGHIEYRKEGEKGFTGLATARNGGVLSARLDDLALVAGRYEVRAVVKDVAGNQAVIAWRLDGAAMLLGLPLRTSTSIDIQAKVSVKSCKAAKRRKTSRRGSARRRCTTRTEARAVRSPIALAHGRALVSTGRLTSQRGTPLAHAGVIVEGQLRSGGPFARLGVARTDRNGAFRFPLQGGPSRTVRYRYDGSDTARPSVAQIVTRVRAAARLKVDRRRLRNGQAVRFTGRLLGKPIPRGGKLVALQARVGGGWRTFATPKANAKGVFRHRYRFTSTTGLRRYAFRALVTREEAYPYEAAPSATVRVTVRGR